jgi:hypothetical protein
MSLAPRSCFIGLFPSQDLGHLGWSPLASAFLARPWEVVVRRGRLGLFSDGELEHD